MIRVLYRVYAGENQKVRPSWYSKVTCFSSLIEAVRLLGDASIFVIRDGHVPWLDDQISTNHEVVTLHESGNSESFLQALAIASTFDDDDIVYFVEDDYLHVTHALVKLRDACEDCPGDYFSLYDHPDRYLPADHGRHDTALRVNAIYLSRSHHWRTIESTCMTFATRVRTLKEDVGVFIAYARMGRVPRDRALFRHLQGLGEFGGSRFRRLLIGPVPSLATHCESTRLAFHVDWEAVAAGVAARPRSLDRKEMHACEQSPSPR